MPENTPLPLLKFDDPAALFSLQNADGRILLTLRAPTLSIDNAATTLRLGETVRDTETPVFGDVTERCVTRRVENLPGCSLTVETRSTPGSPVVRWRWRLASDGPTAQLTRPDNQDALTYFSFSLADFPSAHEQRFSEFSHFYHTFLPTEYPLRERDFAAGRTAFGPMLVAESDHDSLLLAYEHGSQVPDAFLQFRLGENRSVALEAVQANYLSDQEIGPGADFVSPWFQTAAIRGNTDTLAAAYRDWILRFQTPNQASRKPYIFYNTWNYQERVKYWQQRPYLADMSETRMLAEIEIAHRMGIEVFVMDTGWYEKTGDWQVSRARFPNGLAPIKAKLDAYGMQLGLWFNPTVAAVSSRMHQDHRDCLMTHDGKAHDPHEIWETEASQGLCLVSHYGEAFADELIRLHHEVGVTYFKWDAIGQYGCDAAGHGHGSTHHSPDERRRRYGFLLGEAMVNVVNKVCAACPDAIVDFDITEGGRTVGLQFLSAGKYFLINNGPYSHDYQVPTPADGNVNLFFFPGPARTWICRTPLGYDRWWPSVLFLTHYLPDDMMRIGWAGNAEVDAENQHLAIASLVLGQNGIWGDLVAISEAGVARFGRALAVYKEVRDDLTAASPVRTGIVGGTPEVHEKIHPPSGRGAVCLFTDAPGAYTYVTENPVADSTVHNDGVTIERNEDGRAKITATFARGQFAKWIFFGAE